MSTDRKRVVKMVVLVMALGGLGVAAAVALRKPATQTAPARPSEPVPTGGADPSLPRVAVGMVAGYGGVDYVPSTVFDASRLPEGWSYTMIERDW